MKISLVQFAPEWEHKSENMKKLTTILKRKSDLGEILVFPEMTLTGFTMNASAMFANDQFSYRANLQYL